MSSLICSFKLIFHPGRKRESDARRQASTQKPAWDNVSSGLLEPASAARTEAAGAPLREPRGANIVQYSFFGSVWLRIRL
ncbi:hypothetical protein [Burkholderia sp.]|uniref:hypothetical protein n=1 Tax=Burkholderia sp. TaxID=36773 RepID=UPI0025B99016|nr:hypothetical protein [Burkholderia sp.]MBS6362598.1 hypothetical protein [Burkholderia sp.]